MKDPNFVDYMLRYDADDPAAPPRSWNATIVAISVSITLVVACIAVVASLAG